ncbi:hypothetical protein CGZ75_08095 [Paenibacillus herberti]|uniref:Uncharacterized protein n=1 Tax=Paenibacillus herberti TaxID=1619309 RepID=A0A229P3C1_9BACL|nr:hypothetical protein CGZ75_08095 [Paenibacillus herberti]
MILNRTGTAGQIAIRLLFYKKEWTRKCVPFAWSRFADRDGRKLAAARTSFFGLDFLANG